MECVDVVEVTNRDDDKEKFYIQIENTLTHDVLPNAGPAAHGASRQYTYVYRKMSKEEFECIKKTKDLILQTTKKAKMHTAEKWITETMAHTAKYNNKGAVGEQKVAEIKVQKPAYKKIREEAIPQAGSKAKQPKLGEGKPYNITNAELLKDHPGKLNMGIKGKENLDKFNKHIVSIREVNVDTFRKDSAILKWIKRNKLAASVTAIGIMIDVTNITLSVIGDGGKFGHETQVTTGEIIGGVAGAELAILAGAKIGAALGSVVPGIGNFIAGVIGGIIGSLIGGSIVRFFHTLFEKPLVNLDDMPVLETDPTPTINSPPYDCEKEAFGVPTPEYLQPFGVPSDDFLDDSVGVPTPYFDTRGRTFHK